MSSNKSVLPSYMAKAFLRLRSEKGQNIKDMLSWGKGWKRPQDNAWEGRRSRVSRAEGWSM